jgi:probable blue pigment (indigoidine) exporter
MREIQSKDMLLTALAPMFWGSTYIVATEWLPSGYPLFIALMRALPAGLLLCLVLRQFPSGAWWWRSAILGFLNIGLFFVLLFIGATRLPGGVAAIIGSIQPLIVIALAWVVLKEKPSLRSILLAGLGVMGVGLLVATPSASLDALGVLAIIGAALSMAGGTVLTKKWGQPVGLLSFTSWQLVAGGLILLPVALIFEGLPAAITPQQGLGFLYLGVVNTGLSYCLWFRGIKHLPTSTVPILGLLSPLVALLLGYLLLQQGLTPLQLFGGALLLGCVVLSRVRRLRAG